MTSGHRLANIREAGGHLPKLKYSKEKKSLSDFSLSIARKTNKLQYLKISQWDALVWAELIKQNKTLLVAWHL